MDVAIVSRRLIVAALCALVGAMSGGGAARADGPLAKSAKSTERLLCVHGIAAGGSLEVRSGPGADKPEVGRVPADQCGLSLAGKCSGDWCEMTLGDVRGWVDTSHVGVYELPPIGSPPKEKRIAAARTSARRKPQAAVARPSLEKGRTARIATAHITGSPRDRSGGDRFVSAPRWLDPGYYASMYFGACVSRVAWWDTLRIRTGPGVDHEAVGGIPAGSCRVARAGTCHGAWCRVAWRGQVGWVNSYYLE